MARNTAMVTSGGGMVNRKSAGRGLPRGKSLPAGRGSDRIRLILNEALYLLNEPGPLSTPGDGADYRTLTTQRSQPFQDHG